MTVYVDPVKKDLRRKKQWKFDVHTPRRRWRTLAFATEQEARQARRLTLSLYAIAEIEVIGPEEPRIIRRKEAA